MIDQTVPQDPTVLSDPLQQKKIAENVLSQLGLHPNQQGAKSLLDAHFSGPTAHPDIASIVSQNPAPQPQQDQGTPFSGPNGLSGTYHGDPKLFPEIHDQSGNKVPVQMGAPPAAGTTTPEVQAQPPAQKSATVAPSIPAPVTGDPKIAALQTNTANTTGNAQHELDRLIDTGSGVSQIQNPFLRGLARVGDLGAELFVPRFEKDIPGTEGHHSQLIENQEHLINAGVKQGQEEALTQHENVETQKAINNPNELAEWMKENPGVPINKYWEQKANAQMGKLTPDQQELRFLTTPREQGGEGLTVDEAFKTLNDRKMAGKPKTAAQLKSDFQGILQKMSQGQPLDPALMSDEKALVQAIGTSPNLTDEEKQKAFSYVVSSNTPASAAYSANKRANSMLQLRLFNGIDTSTGQLAFVTPEMNQQNPGRYIPASQGQQSMSKEGLFRDIHFNIDQVKETINNLHTDFDATTRAQLALVLKNPHPESAMSSWLQGSAAQTLSMDQIDYVTALASLMENAMSLRSVGQMGQGSDELRSAIMRAIPGPGTPSKDYALRQLELLVGTVSRIEGGVPKSGVTPPNHEPPKTTEQIHNERTGEKQKTGQTITKQAAIDELKRVNEARQAKGLQPYTEEDLNKSLKENGITVQ